MATILYSRVCTREPDPGILVGSRVPDDHFKEQNFFRLEVSYSEGFARISDGQPEHAFSPAWSEFRLGL